MMRSIVLLAACAAVIVFAIGQGLAPAFTNHATKMKGAMSFKAKVSVAEVGGATNTYEVAYGKPNLLRIEGPDRLVVADGMTLTVLDKKANTYVQTEMEGGTAIGNTGEPHVWGWASFFQPDASKLVKTATGGPSRKLRGVDVNEVSVVLADGRSSATLFVDAKLGIVHGYTLKSGDKELIVWAEQLETSMTTPAASAFVFTAPAGATKAATAVASSPSWGEVSAIFNAKCMPCHSASSASGGLDLTNYDRVASSQYVVKGEAMNSILARALTASGSSRMPQGRPPLPRTQIKTIEDWINGGLRK